MIQPLPGPDHNLMRYRRANDGTIRDEWNYIVITNHTAGQTILVAMMLEEHLPAKPQGSGTRNVVAVFKIKHRHADEKLVFVRNVNVYPPHLRPVDNLPPDGPEDWTSKPPVLVRGKFESKRAFAARCHTAIEQWYSTLSPNYQDVYHKYSMAEFLSNP